MFSINFENADINTIINKNDILIIRFVNPTNDKGQYSEDAFLSKFLDLFKKSSFQGRYISKNSKTPVGCLSVYFQADLDNQQIAKTYSDIQKIYPQLYPFVADSITIKKGYTPATQTSVQSLDIHNNPVVSITDKIKDAKQNLTETIQESYQSFENKLYWFDKYKMYIISGLVGIVILYFTFPLWSSYISAKITKGVSE